jgi:uncharacterized repeat protein (TIGR01451 family)
MSSPALAGNGTTSYGAPCTTSYGSTYGSDCTESGNVSVNKLILDPKSGTQTKGGLTSQQFVENLGANDAHFVAGQEVTYKIIVTNTGTKTLTNVLVQDYLPKEISFVSGEGKMENNIFTTTIASLNAGQSREIILKGKVSDLSSLNTSILCNVTNKATVTAEGKTAEDNAALCVEKTAMTVYPAPKTKETPKTGPEALALIGIVPAALSGLLLRKKAYKA